MGKFHSLNSSIHSISEFYLLNFIIMFCWSNSICQILFIELYLLNFIYWTLFVYLLNSIVKCLYLFNSNDLVNHDVNSTGVLRSDVSVYVTGFVLC